MRFLDGPAAEVAIRGLLAKAKRARVAVAYWGDGAVDRLRISDALPNDFVVICDARHGGCNPAEVRRLRKIIGSDRVLTRDGLHAKVWLTNDAAIVGSSNASSNGFGYEGDEAAGLIEANVLVDEPVTLRKIDDWFEKKARLGARPVTEADLIAALDLWTKRRHARDIDPQATTISETLRTNPAFFRDRDFAVWAWDWDDLSDSGRRRLEAERTERHHGRLDGVEYYDLSEPTPNAGAYILEFRVRQNRSAVSANLYQVMNDDPVIRLSRTRRLVLRKPIKAFCGLSLGDRSALKIAAIAAVQEGDGEWYGTGQEFAQLMSRI